MSTKISELTPLVTAATTDVVPIVDIVGVETKKITLTNLKASMSLGNVNNTSDVNKPISTATQTALDDKLESADIADFETTTELNARDVDNRARANHTGTQAASTITGLATVATSGLKADVGLGNVDNTSDVNKPISSATQTALDDKLESADIADFETTTELNARDTANRDRANHTGSQAISSVTNLQTDLDDKLEASDIAVFETTTELNARDVDNRARANHTGTQAISSVTNLQTELDDKLESADIADFETTTELNARDTANRDRANHTGSQAASTITGLATVATSGLKADVGLGSVDNTSDLDKPISTATQTALDLKMGADLTGVNASTARTNLSAVGTVTTGVSGADQITNMMSLTQAEYDAIGTKAANTLYVII